MADAICVLGMHRSGTSLAAQLLEELGVYFGPAEELLSANAANPKGYWEIEKIVHTNDWILQELDRSWDTAFPLPDGWQRAPNLRRHRAQVRRILEEEFAGRKMFGWKDPRVCLTLPLWKDVFKDLGISVHYVLVLRNPLDVARSLAKRDGFQVANGLGLWFHYTLQSLAQTRGLPRVAVRYEDLLDRPTSEIGRLTDALSLDASDTKIDKAVAKAVEPGLCHSRSSSDELWRTAPDLVVEQYELVLRAVSGEAPWGEVDQEAADRLEALKRFAAVLRHDREREVRRSSRIARLEGEMRELRARFARTEQLEQELETIYASTWWRAADHYWRLRRLMGLGPAEDREGSDTGSS